MFYYIVVKTSSPFSHYTGFRVEFGSLITITITSHTLPVLTFKLIRVRSFARKWKKGKRERRSPVCKYNPRTYIHTYLHEIETG